MSDDKDTRVILDFPQRKNLSIDQDETGAWIEDLRHFEGDDRSERSYQTFMERARSLRQDIKSPVVQVEDDTIVEFFQSARRNAADPEMVDTYRHQIVLHANIIAGICMEQGRSDIIPNENSQDVREKIAASILQLEY